MTKIAYIDKKFRKSTLAIIEQANDIIDEYLDDGFKLTLRQLYYQFVARDLVDNTQQSYSRLGSIINDGRLAGLINWGAIEDRTRELKKNSHWDSPAEILNACAEDYAIDKWQNQPYRIEVWIEKEALSGVIEPTCEELDIPFFSCRGYTSQSEMWVASNRLRQHSKNGQEVVILHFGDHDPSGIDMTRDIIDRLRVFNVRLELRRLALNMDQIEEFNPPPNPAKMTDSRFAGYVVEYGDESWELDAIEPKTMAGLIASEVKKLRDEDVWLASCEQENIERGHLAELADNYKGA